MHTALLWFILTTGIVLGPVSPAAALPMLTPHENTEGTIWFEADGVKDGNSNHNHLFNRSVTHSSDAGFKYDTLAVWDNRTYRFGYNKTLKRAEEPAVPYAHGFIQENMRPRYRFKDGDNAKVRFVADADLKDMVDDAVELWVAAARARSAGKTTPDGTALITGIGLDRAVNDQDFEFTIGFFHGLQDAHSTIGLWMLDPLDAFAGGPSADDLKKPVLGFDDSVNWLFDLNLKPAGTQVDFFTVLLHEIGHVFGLDHPRALTGDPITGPEGVLMRAGLAIENAMDGKTFRTVDVSSARGVAGLYTQPVSEPGMLTIFLAALIAVVIAGKQRRLACAL